MLYFLILKNKRKKIGRFFFNSKKNEYFKIHNLRIVNLFLFIRLQLFLGVSDLSILFSNVIAGIKLSNNPLDLSIA